MGKNIVVLMGSPRKKGNSDLMADAFIKGAEAAGHKVVKIYAADKQVKGCVACGACYSKGAPCVFSDDFNELAPVIESADVVVFATPLYWFTFPTQLKAIIDKFYAFVTGDREIADKETALLVCGGDDDEVAFDGIRKTYRLMAEYLHWKSIGEIVVMGVGDKGDVSGTGSLKEAEELGASVGMEAQ